ncbi:Arc family DNA-binding protein [Delftia acidovorans]|uniref:Arc family DNA-binding protein n=1 Tax=Delftia acidovorans TaxID=80866 RepID=UPI001EE0B2C1|nr:Arc family DNA-binding protein [Delftia acidovorans]MCG3784582.1 Arc family DNA-binding protein [Delftia acidovorans]
MASEDVQTNLRLPSELKERLVASAAANNRSLSAEVASRLEASFAGSTEAQDLKNEMLLTRLHLQVSRAEQALLEAKATERDLLDIFEMLNGARAPKDDVEEANQDHLQALQRVRLAEEHVARLRAELDRLEARIGTGAGA